MKSRTKASLLLQICGMQARINELAAQAESDRGKLEAMKEENEQLKRESKFFMAKGNIMYKKHEALKRKFKEVDPGLTDSEGE